MRFFVLAALSISAFVATMTIDRTCLLYTSDAADE